MRKQKLFSIIIVLLLFGFSVSGDEISIDAAKKVDRTLKRIAIRKKNAVILKKITFSQMELNSYLNAIYNKRYAPEIKKIDLKLKEDNVAEGSLHIKLVGSKYKSVPEFLRDVEVEFSGKIECQRYQMRFNFETLKVNGKSFSPELLDEAFGAAQVNYRVKKSLYDWFDLMPGIKNVQLDKEKITLFY